MGGILEEEGIEEKERKRGYKKIEKKSKQRKRFLRRQEKNASAHVFGAT